MNVEVHRSFVALVCIVRQSLERKQTKLYPFRALKQMSDICLTKTLTNWLEEDCEKDETLVSKIESRLAEIGIAIEPKDWKDRPETPVALVYSKEEAYFKLTELELLVDFTDGKTGISNRLRLVADSSPLLKQLLEQGLSETVAKRLGVTGFKTVGQLLNTEPSLTLFELMLLSAELDFDWSKASDFCREHKEEFNKATEALRTSLQPKIQSQNWDHKGTDDLRTRSKKESLSESGDLAAKKPNDETNEEPFDFDGNWDVQAVELGVNQFSFDYLFELQTRQWKFEEQIAQPVCEKHSANAVKSQSPIEEFNQEKANRPFASRFFRGTMFLVNESGTGEHSRLTVTNPRDPQNHRPMWYAVTVAKKNGKVIEARYSFELLIADDGNSKIISYGDFKLTAIDDKELRGFYVGYEPTDMALPGFPKRDFPIVFGLLKVVRPNSIDRISTT